MIILIIYNFIILRLPSKKKNRKIFKNDYSEGMYILK